MSLILLLGAIGIYSGKLPYEELTTEYLVVWALFAIADALWTRRFVK
jgi:hypothetical protein